MEKILNDSEKIKRAEDIYYRRNNISNQIVKKNNSVKDKILFHMLLMINIIVIIFAVQNKNSIFSEQFLLHLSEYNVNLKEKVISLLSDYIKDEKDSSNEDVFDEGQNEEPKTEEIIESENDINLETEKNFSESSSSISEMEQDIENLKISYSFIKPIEGRISSPFGARTSEYQNVTGYHTGTDIASEFGTPIKASMQGIVTLVSNVGDYGNHIKIRCNNVTTLYAHCSKIFVEEGQIIAQGQVIGEVGSTGNSTGPHLHFEIRIDDSRFVDPEEIVL